ncbi:MAG: PIN domain-containing protein [Chloroflexota bacterium]
MLLTNPLLIYLDTNVFSRPFDDQTQVHIQEEANAFLHIAYEIRSKRLGLLCSDILEFEILNILIPDKRSQVQNYLDLCGQYVANSDEVLRLGQNIQAQCQIRPRDALHVAAAILGGARYFLSCDKKITQTKQARCYRRLAKSYHRQYFSVMNPTLFVEKMRKGELR